MAALSCPLSRCDKANSEKRRRLEFPAVANGGGSTAADEVEDEARAEEAGGGVAAAAAAADEGEDGEDGEPTPLPIGELEEEDASEAEEEGVAADGTMLARELYGNNTPSEKVIRKQSTVPVGSWVHIKRIKCPKLKVALNAQGKKSTHVCTICWKRLTLTVDKQAGRFSTTLAVQHLRMFHPDLGTAKASQEKLNVKGAKTVASMLAAGGLPQPRVDVAGPLQNYVVTAEERALSSTARFFV